MTGDPAQNSGFSPAATGPAGAVLEGQVGAHYLLSMLADAEARGAPGSRIDRVALQRAGDGHPLDDVVVYGSRPTADTTVLEIQVKRTVTFSPGDGVFRDVVHQIARALPALDRAPTRHQFAVATSSISFKMSGPYKDVLRWARDLGDHPTFFARIHRKGVGNDDMRRFVSTFRDHLREVDCAHDDETVWHLLRRFQILAFDFEALGSSSLELSIERASRVLAPSEAHRARALWQVLTDVALRAASAGGDLDRAALVQRLVDEGGFRLAGSRRSQAARDDLADAARSALADMKRTVGGITLARTKQIDAVRSARDSGRYIEIRGAAGVGKSGLLAQVIEEVLLEGRAVVLTAERTIPRGWLALKSHLHIEGSATEFLSDLASDGGCVLFVDSLDSFTTSEARATVGDLVRAAADVAGFQVIVSARTDFDADEPNWLPTEAITRLGAAPAVVLHELGPDEIDELSIRAPSLRHLLSQDHPAHAVTKNLFRLSRIAEHGASAETPRTEVDIAERWWQTADGLPGPDRRNRARLLADLADAAISGAISLDVRQLPAAVDALVASESVREIRRDRLVFSHDVLRDWAAANRLNEEPELLGQFDLVRPVLPSLARGIELAGRFAIERSGDGSEWSRLLSDLSPPNAHPSWRRNTMLAVLRSEMGTEMLDRAAAVLLSNDGGLLRELIRTAIAVESEPLKDRLKKISFALPVEIPTGIIAPTNESWARLVFWLIEHREDLPSFVQADAVELFGNYSLAHFCRDPLTPHIAEILADWLMQIEGAGSTSRLASDMRRSFAMMAACVPDRAEGYLQAVTSGRHSDEIIREIMSFRGTFASAAPAALEELTVAGLIDSGSSRRRMSRGEAFTWLDSDFLPASPAQGPFLDLLNVAPQHGLSLIRRLVAHAVASRSRGRTPGEDGMRLVLQEGPRFFPWLCSYHWSRNGEGGYAVQSGLLALEAWSHSRLEKDEPPEAVIADIIGDPSSCAAYLLIAVDLILSHWPKTDTVSVPFLGCPELLSLERSRPIYDAMGGSVIGTEPPGPVRLADLAKRPSRRMSLEALLPRFALRSDDHHRLKLRSLLSEAKDGLAGVEENATFADPALMVRHALNIIDPANWKPIDNRMQYVAPPEEEEHVARLEAGNRGRNEDYQIDAAVQLALEDPSRTSHDLAEKAVDFARRLEQASDGEGALASSSRHTVVSAAMVVMRDGSDAFAEESEGWARMVFANALESKEDLYVSRDREGIRYNPVSIAALGLVHIWRRRGDIADRNALLRLAARSDPHAAQGISVGLPVLRSGDDRLARAILRCALAAQIHPSVRHDRSGPGRQAAEASFRRRVEASVDAEIAWLDRRQGEPVWPQFPRRVPGSRRGIRLSIDRDAEEDEEARPEPEYRVDLDGAALWLKQIACALDVGKAPWAANFIETYGDWTAIANGLGLPEHADVYPTPMRWNHEFYELLIRAIPAIGVDAAKRHLEQIGRLPHQAFYDILTRLVFCIDIAYFNDGGVELATAIDLRTMLVSRLLGTWGWRRAAGEMGYSVEVHLAPAIAVSLMNHHGRIGPAVCYLQNAGIERVAPFFCTMQPLMREGPLAMEAPLTLNLLEVSASPDHGEFLLTSAETWLDRAPDETRLWVDMGVGARIARWLEASTKKEISLLEAAHPLRPRIDNVLAKLVRAGVADAHRVERLLQ